MADWRAETGMDGEGLEGLEAYFAAARATAPEPSSALLLRIEEQGLALAAAGPAPAVQRARPGFWHRLSVALGGRGAVAGLVTATLAGLWLGFAPPADLSALSQAVSQDVLGSTVTPTLTGVDLMPSVDTVLNQG